MYKEGQIVEVRLEKADAKGLSNGVPICVNPAQIIGYEKPFDWATVKPGMAFIHDDGKDIVRYIGPFLTSSRIVCVFPEKSGEPVFLFKSSLNRAPEHDIEVPE